MFGLVRGSPTEYVDQLRREHEDTCRAIARQDRPHVLCANRDRLTADHGLPLQVAVDVDSGHLQFGVAAYTAAMPSLHRLGYRSVCPPAGIAHHASPRPVRRAGGIAAPTVHACLEGSQAVLRELVASSQTDPGRSIFGITVFGPDALFLSDEVSLQGWP